MLDKLYTKKQIDVLHRALTKDYFILIQHGAKRAGKTITNNDLFLSELKRVRKIADYIGVQEPQYILAGNSLGNVERNVLNEITNKYGIDFKMNKYNEFVLLGVKVCCFGHGTIADIRRIRGMTSFGAYINEGSTANNEVFKEIISRCSGEGARIMVDTNPDNPMHWLKTDYIDKADGEKIVEFHYNLYDNTFLSTRYIENIINATPSGVFHDRDILGLWVSAEGLVYKDFRLDKHVIKELPKDIEFTRYIGGVDWGHEHYGSVVVLGITQDDTYYLLEEIAEQHQYVSDFWIPKMLELQEKYPNIMFYADHARPEHIELSIENGVYMEKANKSVQEGIELVGSLLKQNKIFFLEDKFKKGSEEMFLYSWQTKTLNGKDEVIKTNDDVLDSLRYACYTDFKLYNDNDIFIANY